MPFVLKLAFVVAALYGVVAVAAFIAQRKLMYFPDRARVPPSSFALTGVRSACFRRPMARPSSPGTVLPLRAGPRCSISMETPAIWRTVPSACASIWRAGSAFSS